MSRRPLIGQVSVAALAVLTWTACTKKSGDALDKRCVQLAKVCGDQGKHVDKMVDECKEAAKKQVSNGCTEKVSATYDCYERELCGSGDKVWTIEDLRLLATRHHKCVTEQAASLACAEK